MSDENSAEKPTVTQSLQGIVAAAKDGLKLDFVCMVGTLMQPDGSQQNFLSHSEATKIDVASTLTIALAIAARDAFPGAKTKDMRRELHAGIDQAFKLLNAPALMPSAPKGVTH